MTRPRRARRLIAGGVVIAFVAAIVIAAAVAGGGSGSSSRAPTSSTGVATSVPIGASPSGSPTTTAVAAPADVAAARACEAFAVYLVDAEHGLVPAAAGRALTESAAVLLRGARHDQATGRAQPRWSTLGSDLLAAADDIVHHRSTALGTDGAEAGAQCREVPAAAAAAGGFQRSG